MKKFTTSLLTVALSASLGFSLAEAKELKFAYASNATPTVEAMHKFGELVEEKTNGDLKIKFFPNSQLGGEKELVELLKIGGIDFTKVSGGLLESFVPVYGVFSMPYLFDSQEHYYKALDSDEIMKPIYETSQTDGFVGLTYYDSGARSFYTTKKPIETVEDLKGLKLRVMESPTAIRMVELLGATPIAMSQSEVYTSLQQGVLDGAENNEFVMTVARHAEVAKNYSYDVHTRIPDIMLVSQRTLSGLSPEHQQAVLEAAKESTEFHKGAWKAAVDAAKKECEDDFGVTFYYPDIAPFQAAVQPMYDDLKNEPEKYMVYEQIRKIAE